MYRLRVIRHNVWSLFVTMYWSKQQSILLAFIVEDLPSFNTIFVFAV